MGNSSSNSVPTGKNIIASKLNVASKTGVLNLADQKLTNKSNVLVSLGDRDFATKLKTLDLSGNKLSELPVAVLQLTNLKTLLICRCSLTTLPDTSSLVHLVKIDASNNELRDDTLSLLPSSVQHCHLNGNHFTQLPFALLGLSHLIELHLIDNNITSLSGIGHLVELSQLYLDNNQLRDVPAEIGQLKKLKLLSLKHNQIQRYTSNNEQSLPRELFEQTSVVTIHLEGNVSLSKADVMAYEGIEAFLDRRQKSKDRSLMGGAMTDLSIFGII